MDHPEKALFEEVKGLKTQMEEVRNRIFKVEATYIEKVEKIEKREYTSIQVDKKIEEYENNLNTMKLIRLDGKKIPLFRGTIVNNIYVSKKLLELFDNDSNFELIIDQDYNYFYLILNIIKKGHNYFCLDDEDKQSVIRKYSLNIKNLEKDPLFIQILNYFFDEDAIKHIAVDFNLDYSFIPENVGIKSIKSSCEGLMTHLDKHKLTSENKNDLLNKDNKKGIFLDYTNNVVIELDNIVRIKKLGLKPFTADTSAFYPTTGSYYPTLYVSEDGSEYTSLGVMPSDYGSVNNDYVSNFLLNSHKNIKFIKVETNSSSQWSLSYIKLNYEKDDKKKK